MKKSIKKTIMVCAAIAVLSASVFVPVHAEEEEPYVEDEIVEDYQYTNTNTSSLTISGTKSTSVSRIVGDSTVTKIVITQKLQKKSGTEWVTIYSWKETFNSNSATYTNSKSNLSKGSYRTHTFAHVHYSGGYETVRSDSATKSIS